MRVILKAGRCLKRSFLFIAIWIFGFSVYSFTFENASLTSGSASRAGRVGGRKTASVDKVLNNSAALENDTLNDHLSEAGKYIIQREADILDKEILRRIIDSRAGNFTYVPNSNGQIYDTSRGQFNVIDKYLNKKEHGFFVELGTEGNEPTSLTFLLERSRGWTGLVIEPDVEKFQSLMQMKRNSKFIQACINAASEVWPTKGSSETQCLKLATIFKAINRNQIDLLVLDVSGQELPLLTSFPFKEIHVSMINVEIHGTSKFVKEIVDELKIQFDSVQLMTNHIYKKTDMIFLNKKLKIKP